MKKRNYTVRTIHDWIVNNRKIDISFDIIIDPLNYMLPFINNDRNITKDKLLKEWDTYKQLYYTIKNSKKYTINAFEFFVDDKYRNEIKNKFCIDENYKIGILNYVNNYDSITHETPLINKTLHYYKYADSFLEFYDIKKNEFDSILSEFKINIKLKNNRRFEFHPESSRINSPINKDKTAFIFSFFKLKENPYIKKNFDIIKKQFDKDDVFVGEVVYFGLPFDIKESEIQGLRYEATDRHLLWQKERVINNIIKKLPSKYTNVAWIDGDILFDCDDLAYEINKALKTKSIIQLFNKAVSLNEDGEPIIEHHHFTSTAHNGGHSGFGWAARREEFEDVLLTERAIFGNDDIISCFNFHNMEPKWNINIALNEIYGLKYIQQNHLEKVKNNITSGCGYIHINATHLFHNNFKNRKYVSRNESLLRYSYDPFEDLIDKDGELLKWRPGYDREKIAEAFKKYICGE